MSDTKAKKTNRRFKFKLPHVYTIMFLLIVVFAVLTWIVPSGQYQRKTISTAAGEREVAVAGTYEQVDKNYTDSETGETINLGQDIFAVLQAPTKASRRLRRRCVRLIDWRIVRSYHQDQRFECRHEPCD